MINPRILKGFRDSLPQLMIQKKQIIYTLEKIFESYGFAPIDTPAIEYTEILLGKGGGETDKQIYRFNDRGRNVSLRFDLTVPLARFISQYYNELVFPFKCYHVAPVWRGENTQKGRYREFYQCDFDILGSTSINTDVEILLLIRLGMKSLNAGNFIISINNRKILNTLLEQYGLSDKSADVLRTIDKVYKIGVDNVLKEMTDNLKIDQKMAEKLLRNMNILGSSNDNFEITGEDIFENLSRLKKITKASTDAVDDMEYIFNFIKNMGVLENFAFNPAITRGLDYYTGIVFETFVLDRRNFGSVCSGGRYDNLTSLYSKNQVPGVGASFGLDRLLGLLEDKGLLNKKSTKTDLLIFFIDDCFEEYQKLANDLRSQGINTEVYFEKKKINAQFKFAERKKIKYVLIAGKDEILNNTMNIKNIDTGEEKSNIGSEKIKETILDGKSK